MTLNRLTAWKLQGFNFTVLNTHRAHWYAYNSVFYVSQSSSQSKYEENCHLECVTMKSGRSLLTFLPKILPPSSSSERKLSKQAPWCTYICITGLSLIVISTKFIVWSIFSSRTSSQKACMGKFQCYTSWQLLGHHDTYNFYDGA